MTTRSDTPGEGLADLLQRIKAFHDRDEGCNGFTADYEILRREIDEAVAGLRSPSVASDTAEDAADIEAAQLALQEYREKGGTSLADIKAELASDTAALPSGYEGLERALEEITNPLAAMKKRADAEGSRLSGMAYQIANDANYLKQIAKNALASAKRFKGE